MSRLSLLVVLSAAFVAITATPAVDLGGGCTITSFNQVDSVVKSCSNIVISGLTVPAGKTLELNLKDNAKLTFQGTTKFEHHVWKGPLVIISGNKITVTGASGSKLDGQGPAYWDGKGEKTTKPKFFKIKAKGGSVFKNLQLLNCPVQCVSIDSCSDLTLSNFNIDNSAGKKLGHNTDGFDISSSKNLIIDNAHVTNQDDCIAVNKGSNMIFRNIHCSGGHGLSISVGQSKTGSFEDNTIKNVTFIDSYVTDSDNGIHVKTHSDAGKGSLTDVTYQNIEMSGIRKFGINIEQDYENGKPTGKPKNNIPITKFTAKGIRGHMTGSNSMAVKILCAQGGCSNWVWSGVSLSDAAKKSSCTASPVKAC
nr:polygalacturonase-like [Leptinotarsa decemlineata]